MSFNNKQRNDLNNAGYIDNENSNEECKEYHSNTQDLPEIPTQSNNFDAAEDETPWGYGECCLMPQCCNNPKMILFWLSYFSFVQGFVCNGVVNIDLSSIEKRFDLKSEEVSYIAISYEIAAGLLVLPATYFGTHGHKPKLLSLAALIMCIGSFIMALPHFITGNYAYGSLNSGYCGSETPSNMCAQSKLSDYLYVFILGQLLHAVGGTVVYSIGYVYLDDNLSTRDSPFYQSIMMTASSFGPAVGYLFGGQLLELYVDFMTVDVNDLKITSADPGWVGAWWLGFLISGICSVPAVLMIFPFPKLTPAGIIAQNHKEDEVHNGNENIKDEFLETWRKIPSALMELLKNPVLMLTAAATVVETMIVNVFSTFGPKIMENKFSLTASSAAINTGLIAIPGTVIGHLLGGYIVKKLNLKIRGMVKLCMISSILCCFLSAFAFLSCDALSIAGVTVPYINDSSIDLISQCNENCNCTTYSYEPICGRDGIQYFSPCHAGCETSYVVDNDTKVFANCSCIVQFEAGSLIDHNDMAVNYPCKLNCSNFYIYGVILFILIVLVFIATVPIMNVTLRCIPDNRRAFGLGVTLVFTRLLGTAPGPLIIGYFFDKYCTVWQETCNGETGSCWIYDNTSFGLALFVMCLVLKLLSTFFFLVTHIVYKPPNEKQDSNCMAAVSPDGCFDNPTLTVSNENISPK